MMEAPLSDSASEDDLVPGKILSIDSPFVFIEEGWGRRPEYQSGTFCRLDHKGTPIVETGTALLLPGGTWTNVGISNELILYRSIPDCEWEYGYDTNNYTYNCYVANGDLVQVMPIPAHPNELDDGYSIVALGLSWFDSDCWKLIAVLKSKLDSTTFADDEFAKVGTFDPETGAWTTQPARFSDDVRYYFESDFSDDFRYYFESDSDLFYLNSSPVYHGGALYWVHVWNTKKRNVDVPVPGREYKLRPLSLLKLCLKTNVFRLIHMPVSDKRNVGLLCKSEGRVTYCHLCPDAGLRIWVLDDDDDDDDYASGTVWRPTHYMHTNLIDWTHTNLIEGRICKKDFLSVLAFNKELHTVVFRIDGYCEDLVCFDFEEKKVVSKYTICDCLPSSWLGISHFEHHPNVPPGEVAKLWIQKKKAPYHIVDEGFLGLSEYGIINDPGFAVNKGLDLTRKRSRIPESDEGSEGSEGSKGLETEGSEGSEGLETEGLEGSGTLGCRMVVDIPCGEEGSKGSERLKKIRWQWNPRGSEGLKGSETLWQWYPKGWEGGLETLWQWSPKESEGSRGSETLCQWSPKVSERSEGSKGSETLCQWSPKGSEGSKGSETLRQWSPKGSEGSEALPWYRSEGSEAQPWY